MTWTYSGDPSQSRLDAVRFLIGDITSTDKLLEDEEILFLLAEFNNDTFSSAAAAAETLAAKFAREVSVSVDGMSYSGGELSDKFAKLAEQLRLTKRTLRRKSLPYVGGISWTDRLKDDLEPDLIPTHFRSHMHVHPESSEISGPRGYDNPLRPGQ